jgi:hypothetical protein
MAEPILVGIEQNKFIKDNDTKMKTLFCPVAEPIAVYSLHDDTDTNYQVPADKKFIILKIQMAYMNTSGGSAVYSFYEHNVADTAGGTKKFGTLVADGTSSTGTIYAISEPAYIEISTGNYINFDINKGRGGLIITGVELNA